MQLRADFTKTELVHTDNMPWQDSPMAGVQRKRLELSGPAEAGRVTSVVRYAPGSQFRAHEHPEGEEILVLEGIFSDERGDHPAGTYLLNAEGFRHAPYSVDGCVIFVKLRQHPGRRESIRLRWDEQQWRQHPSIPGVEQLQLYRNDTAGEQCHLTRIAKGASLVAMRFPAGEEVFVLEGDLSDEHGALRKHSWLRMPPGGGHSPRTETGCLLYVKKGHLPPPSAGRPF